LKAEILSAEDAEDAEYFRLGGFDYQLTFSLSASYPHIARVAGIVD